MMTGFVPEMLKWEYAVITNLRRSVNHLMALSSRAKHGYRQYITS